LWTPELRWLLDRSIALVRADLGGHGWLSPGPELPRERGPAWRHLRTGPAAAPARRHRHQPAHPRGGPMTPEAVTASLDEARAFFPRHFPDERYTTFSCGSWLLDPRLLEYLPEDSNIVRFQQRFELEPYEEPEGLDADVEVLWFVPAA
jgi:hypothetical protein